jgi:hypothetical protein
MYSARVSCFVQVVGGGTQVMDLQEMGVDGQHRPEPGFRGVSVLESEVTESDEVDVVSDEIRRLSSLSEGECQHFVSVENGMLNEFEMM